MFFPHPCSQNLKILLSLLFPRVRGFPRNLIPEGKVGGLLFFKTSILVLFASVHVVMLPILVGISEFLTQRDQAAASLIVIRVALTLAAAAILIITILTLMISQTLVKLMDQQVTFLALEESHQGVENRANVELLAISMTKVKQTCRYMILKFSILLVYLLVLAHYPDFYINLATSMAFSILVLGISPLMNLPVAILYLIT